MLQTAPRPDDPNLPAWIESAIERAAEAVALSGGASLGSQVKRLHDALLALGKAYAADHAGTGEQFAAAESSDRAAIAARAAVPTPTPAPPANPVATTDVFGPVIERELQFDPFFTADNKLMVAYLDLESGNIMNAAPPGDIGSLLGESDVFVRHSINLTAVAVPADRWNAAPAEVLGELARATPQKQVRLAGRPSGRPIFSRPARARPARSKFCRCRENKTASVSATSCCKTPP